MSYDWKNGHGLENDFLHKSQIILWILLIDAIFDIFSFLLYYLPFFKSQKWNLKFFSSP